MPIVKKGSSEIEFEIAISGFSLDDSKQAEKAADFKLSWNSDLWESIKDSQEFETVDPLTIEAKEYIKVSGFYVDGEPGHSLSIPKGVTAIYGMTGSGKSELAKLLHKHTKADFIRFHEPELPALLDYKELFRRIEAFLLDPEREILIIDSFRFFVYNTEGRRAAGKGGISSALYSDLTALSVLASYLNKSIIIVINPMTNDEKEVERIAHVLEGSLSAVMQARKYGSFKMTARTKASLRTGVLYTFASTQDDAFGSKETEDCSDDEQSQEVFELDSKEIGHKKPSTSLIASAWQRLL